MSELSRGEGTYEEPEHLGEKYLRLLGYGKFANTPVKLQDGSTIAGRDFLDACPEYVLPVLVGFEAMDPADPAYPEMKEYVQGFGAKMFGAPPEIT